MRTHLGLSDQVVYAPHPNPTYPERPNMPALQKVQTPSSDKGEMKKRSKTKQTSKRQYKVRVVVKPLVLPRVTATLIPTSTSTTPPTMTNPMRATTPGTSIVPATTNLFVTRTWLIPPTKENGPVPADRKYPTEEDNNIMPYSFCPFNHGSSTTSSNPTANNIMAAQNMEVPRRKMHEMEPNLPVLCSVCTTL